MGVDHEMGDERCFVIDTTDFPIVRMIFPRISNHESIDRNFDNMLAVAAYQAYLWMKTDRPYPTKAFSSELDALDWCRGLVAEARAEQAG